VTPKQQRFVDEYIADPNATQAAIRAGYSVNCAAEIGYENLNKPEIASAIAKASREMQERTQITTQWVLERLVAEATSVGEGSTQSARIQALGLIGKHLGMFIERHEHYHGDIESALGRIAEIGNTIRARRAGTVDSDGRAHQPN